MINERTTEKYSAIYYGIIREGVKKMIRARISQTQKEFKSDIRVLIDPYTALWIEISDNSNQWKLKVKRDGITPQETTLFPENWSKSRIIVEVDIAYENKIISQTRNNI